MKVVFCRIGRKRIGVIAKKISKIKGVGDGFVNVNRSVELLAWIS